MRATTRDAPSQTKAVSVATMPQLIMIRPSHRRAPKRWSRRLLGISNTTKLRKKMPAASPNTVDEIARSFVISVSANPMLTRSAYAITCISTTSGRSRRKARATARLEAAGAAPA